MKLLITTDNLENLFDDLNNSAKEAAQLLPIGLSNLMHRYATDCSNNDILMQCDKDDGIFGDTPAYHHEHVYRLMVKTGAYQEDIVEAVCCITSSRNIMLIVKDTVKFGGLTETYYTAWYNGSRGKLVNEFIYQYPEIKEAVEVYFYQSGGPSDMEWYETAEMYIQDRGADAAIAWVLNNCNINGVGDGLAAVEGPLIATQVACYVIARDEAAFNRCLRIVAAKQSLLTEEAVMVATEKKRKSTRVDYNW